MVTFITCCYVCKSLEYVSGKVAMVMLLWQHHVVPCRIERLEFFDETELLEQLLQHYCLSCGANDALGMG